MPCYYPVGRYDKTNKPVLTACGYCFGCKMEQARQWAIRCYHESMLYEKNCFISLTYNEKNIPDKRSLKKKHLQKFVKRLRRNIEPEKMRFYGCGEYGENFNRPHYHLLVFGYDFADKTEFYYQANQKQSRQSEIPSGYWVYRSKLLEKTWKKGYSTLTELTFGNCLYVARYVKKKINSDMAQDHYNGKEQEFALMSRMPGIGKEWLEKYYSDVYPKDFLTINGHKHKPPKYYDDCLKKVNEQLFNRLKEVRKKKMPKVTGKRLVAMEKYRKLISRDERNFENGNC